MRKKQEVDPIRQAAYMAVHKALREGTLVKEPCMACGKAKVEAHHEDYTKPLDVRWLCNSCHKILHYATTRSPVIHSEETKKKISEKLKGRVLPEEVKAKMRGRKGCTYSHTKEARAKISEARKGISWTPARREAQSKVMHKKKLRASLPFYIDQTHEVTE